jgi:plastocyanin
MTPPNVSLHALSALCLVSNAWLGCGDDSTPTRDAGGDAGASSGGPCAEGDFADGAPRIEFGGVGASSVFSYTPRCLRVSAGTTVRFAGDLAVHPLSPGSSPGEPAGGNPIPRTATGNELEVTFAYPGTYPYICEYHYAAGMRGAVRVVP